MPYPSIKRIAEVTYNMTFNDVSAVETIYIPVCSAGFINRIGVTISAALTGADTGITITSTGVNPPTVLGAPAILTLPIADSEAGAYYEIILDEGFYLNLGDCVVITSNGASTNASAVRATVSLLSNSGQGL
jgi:hypothetical protein